MLGRKATLPLAVFLIALFLLVGPAILARPSSSEGRIVVASAAAGPRPVDPGAVDEYAVEDRARDDAERLRAETEAQAAREAQEAEDAARAERERQAAARAQRPTEPVSQPVSVGYPRGCTASGTFDPAPCVPRGPCAIPERVCAQEAGSVNVWNYSGSGASGKYQAMPGTWGGYAGYRYAAWAPESVQDAWAVELWNGGRGCGHWAMC